MAKTWGRYTALSANDGGTDPTHRPEDPDTDLEYDELECSSKLVPASVAAGFRRCYLGGACLLFAAAVACACACWGPRLVALRSVAWGSKLVQVVLEAAGGASGWAGPKLPRGSSVVIVTPMDPSSVGARAGAARGGAARAGAAGGTDTRTAARASASSGAGAPVPPACHDTTEGEACHRRVLQAMRQGSRMQPERHGKPAGRPTLYDLQLEVHKRNASQCPRPCSGCHDARQGEECFQDLEWAMRVGILEHPEWYPGLAPEARLEEFQAALHGQNTSKCPRPCRAPDPSRRQRGVPGASLDLPLRDEPWEQRRKLSFYMYRAQSAADFPLENVDAADLAGVMWYLHNEIVPTVAVHRKYNITRLMRFKLTMKTTWEFYNVHRRQFGGFVAFDSGRCTVPACDDIWEHFGFIVGCQFQNTKIAGYLSSTRTRLGEACQEPYCNSSVWYSLPGPCPSMEYSSKTRDCQRRMPGGRCEEVTGERDCTYSVEEAGEISLDELAGIEDYREFFNAGYREYVHAIDSGVGNTFWNGKLDLHLCKKRVERVKALFKQKYPQLPGCDELPEPPCDFDAYYPGELSWPAQHEPMPRAS